MKKKVKKLIVPLIAALLALVSVILFFWDYSVPVMASDTPFSDDSFSVPYETLTLGPNGGLVPTQTAFTPSGRISFSSSSVGALLGPEDMITDADRKSTRLNSSHS